MEDEQLKLFGKYPYQPGYQDTDTSREAAEVMKPRAGTLREKVWGYFQRKNCTADEIATYLGESVLAVRPRVTELARQGLIADTGVRRKNNSGRKAIVWGMTNIFGRKELP